MLTSKVPMGEKHPKCTFPTLLSLCSHPSPCPWSNRCNYLASWISHGILSPTYLMFSGLPLLLGKKSKPLTGALSQFGPAAFSNLNSHQVPPCPPCWGPLGSFPSLDLSLFLWTGMIYLRFFIWLGSFHASDHRSNRDIFPMSPMSCGLCPVTFHYVTGSFTACTTINNYLLFWMAFLLSISITTTKKSSMGTDVLPTLFTALPPVPSMQ